MRVMAICVSLASLLVATVPTSATQQPPVRPRITGISHMVFRVTDAAAAYRFYADLLGLEAREVARGGARRFMVGAQQWLQIEPGLAADQDERLSHLAFSTPDVGALSAYLSARGVEVSQPADRCADSAIRVADPDGHTIEFVQSRWPPTPASPVAGAALSNRILHGGLTIRDELRAHQFYRDILGFGEIWRGGRTEGATDWVNMRVPDGTDYLEYMLTAKPPDRRQRGVLHHACLRVADIQTAWEAVVSRNPPAGSAPAPPSVGRNGRWLLNLYDPDGTRIELMEPFTIR